MKCKKDRNLTDCPCTWPGCANKGICCDCIRSHLAKKQLPGCCFPGEAEKTYDRSFENFARAWNL